MSIQITTHFVKQYQANLDFLVQQKGSRLRRGVTEEDVTGESGFFDRIGSTEAEEITSRHQDTPRSDTPHDRRRWTGRGFVWADLIDKEDKIRMLTDPTSEYAMAGAWAMGRKIDDIIIEAVDATAYSGKEGSTSVSYDSNMTVDVQIRAPGVSASDFGLNVAKLLRAGKLLTANEVDPEEERFIASNAAQCESLLNDPRVSSHDYNTLKPLVDGKIVYYAGFNIIPTERILNDGNGDNKVPYWVKSGIKLGIPQDIETRIGERADKNYSTQVWVHGHFGAVRMEEAKVGYIECDPTAGPGV